MKKNGRLIKRSISWGLVQDSEKILKIGPLKNHSKVDYFGVLLGVLFKNPSVKYSNYL